MPLRFGRGAIESPFAASNCSAALGVLCVSSLPLANFTYKMLLAIVNPRRSRFQLAPIVFSVLFLVRAAFAAPPSIQIPRIENPPTLADF